MILCLVLGTGSSVIITVQVPMRLSFPRRLCPTCAIISANNELFIMVRNGGVEWKLQYFNSKDDK